MFLTFRRRMIGLNIFLILYLIWNVSALNKFRRFDRTLHKQYVVSDNIREDDHEDFELSDIMALSSASIDMSRDPPTPEERKLHVDVHNAYRSNFTKPFPEGSDMNMMEYNNTLEWTAGEMLKNCKMDHFFADNDNMTDWEGQSIYRGPTHLNSRAIYLHYMEYPDYFFHNFSCREPFPKYQCGHMLQVMAAESHHVGFNRNSQCYGRTYRVMMVTHYLPGGVGVLKQKEFFNYKYGISCSNCLAGYYCAGNLCIPDPKRFCKAYNLDCECKRTCHNCGTYDWKNCKCTCKLGWDWDDCSFPCQNRIEEKRPSWKLKNMCAKQERKGMCTKWRNYKDVYCRKVCKTCFPVIENSEPDKLCCGGKMCDEFYALDLDTCECNLMCPSQICLFITDITTTTVDPTTILPLTSSATSPKSAPTVILPFTSSTTSQKPAPTTTPLTSSTTSQKPAPTIILSLTSSTTSQKPKTEKEPRPISTALIVTSNPKLILWISFIFFLIS